MLKLLFLFLLLWSCGQVLGQGTAVTKSNDIVVIRGKSYYLHTVQPGQTLYSICKAYGANIDEVKSLNDKKDNALSLYEVLKVPYTDPFVQQDDKFYYHKVVKGETFYSIARLYKIKPKRLLKFNEGYAQNQPLAVGAVVKLPLAEIDLSVLGEEEIEASVGKKQEIRPERPVRNESVKKVEEASVTDILQNALMQKNEKTEQEPEKEITTVIGATDKMEIPDYISEVVMPVDPFVKVALLLPFSAKDYPVFVDTLVEKMPVQISARSEQFISFYEGVLLAVDSLKNQGYKVNLKVFDTERSAEKMYTMVDEIDRFHPDLIIGPVYGSVYKALMDDLTNKNIPVIYPLSSRSEEFGVYPDFIQVNPSMKALTECNNPKRASIPFDKERSGFVMGEGAGILVLEELEHAKARGAHIYAEVVGYGATSDAHHLTAPIDDGSGDAKAIEFAIKDAGIKPEDIDYINAHGTSTHMNDAFETKAIKLAMGDAAYQCKVNSTKSMVGHLLGAAGGVEAITCVKSIMENYVHANIGLVNQDPECDLDCPKEAVETKVDVALSNSLGFGGHNAVLIFKAFAE